MDLPSLPEGWRIEKHRLISDGIGGRVWLVTREDGTSAILKEPSALAIRDGDASRAVDFLRWRDGHAAVNLLATADDIILLEHGGTRLLLDHRAVHGDDAATEIAAETMARLHAPSPHPVPATLQPLTEHFASLFRKATEDRDQGMESLYPKAAALAQELLEDQRDVRPLHGDLHHENILFGPRGWLSIDPKGLIGDPLFDAANMFSNPIGDRLCLSENRIAYMAEVFAKALGRDMRAVVQYAFAYGCLSAAWHAEDGNGVEERAELRIADAIRAVMKAMA